MEIDILEKAKEMFLNYGFKNATMDDIASEMGISKKTLYKYYDNKIALVEATVEKLHQSCLCVINRIIEENYNPIEENLKIKEMFREMFKNLGGSPLFQLQKYYPKIYEKVMQVEMKTFSECIKNNIERGIEEGYYLKNTNVDLCAEFYLAIIFSIHRQEKPQSEVLELEYQALVYHTRAIATLKGLEELENQLKEKQQ